MTTAGFIPVGDGEYVGSNPSERFPVWTRGNAGEVYPHVIYPLTYTSSWDSGVRAMKAAVLKGGLIGNKDFSEGPDVAVASGVFGGYAYLNLTFARVTAIRFPGGKAEDVDISIMGQAEAPPHVAHPDDKSILASLRGLRHVVRTLRTKELPQLDADKAKVRDTRGRLGSLSQRTDDELRSEIDRLQPFFQELFTRHLFVSGQAAMMSGVLTKICEDNLDDPNMAIRLTAGIGDVESAAPSAALFRLGRLVADSDDLTAEFDSGLEGIEDRIAALDSRGAVEFAAHFERFLFDFGSRGPNEWDLGSEVWDTDHRLPLALIDRMRGADETHDPALQQQRLSTDRQIAVEDARSQLKGLTRKFFDRALQTTVLFSQGRERAKTTVVAGIHEVRMAVRELDRRAIERGGGGQKGDILFVTVDELDQYLTDPTSRSNDISERRRMFDFLSSLEPPFFIDGEMPPVETWPKRGGTLEHAMPGTVLTGLPGCTGLARGTARIVTSPGDPGALGPGDVLIAPLTDPAWTPLFVPADAVVVDVGAVMSHAAIVSRELGIPCVVSVTDASKKIRDGDIVEVDGDAGTVTIIG